VAHLGDGRSSLVFTSDGGMPTLAHWGAAIGPDPLDPAWFERAIPHASLDADVAPGLVAEAGAGWFGRPGLQGHRGDGADFQPRFRLVGTEATDVSARFELLDEVGGLSLVVTVAHESSGVTRFDAALTNRGGTAYQLDALRLTLPVPAPAREVLTVGGRWGLEYGRFRHDWERATVVVENRRGKTSHDRLGLIVAGTPGFGEEHGQVWACHLAWSGNHELVADSVTDGHRVLQAGELLLPGELSLEPGGHYRAPTVFAVHGPNGLNSMSQALHRHLRARPGHPRLPRPVHLNTWEAVYFDHDHQRLFELARVAAEVGVERFVLDDGWFHRRRHDRAGLGDWWPDPDVWPDGLGPLIDRVRSLGMEFGLWVEPEMVNPDSDLFRQHPEWVLGDRRHPPVVGRHQLVLDLGRPEVADLLFERLDRLLAGNDIAYLKWDHNRDLVAPTSGARAGVHDQTLALYRLLDRLRSAHPGVEIESCASGGGRLDLAILARTDRVWASDSIDALDRLAIQRGFTLLAPPELMGTHIGAPTAHVTGRHHSLAFRAATAFGGALGIEWNLLEASEDERAELAAVIELHKRFRLLLHRGRHHRVEHPDPTVDGWVVVAAGGSEAVLSITRTASGPSPHLDPVSVPGLDPDRRYRLRPLPIGRPERGGARRQPAWLTATEAMTMTGRQLATVGVRPPLLHPESSVVIHLAGTGGDDER
jgi:alpha-galactosidase